MILGPLVDHAARIAAEEIRGAINLLPFVARYAALHANLSG
jgi:hypothetical protein